MKAKILLLTSVMALCFAPPKVCMAVLFDDGGIHTIDYLLEGNIQIYNSPTGAPTTINITDGAIIAESFAIGIQAFDDSIINISGGILYGDIRSHHNTQVNISDGTLAGVFGNIHAKDSSQVFITGGEIEGGLTTYANSQGCITDGVIRGWIGTTGDSIVNIFGGQIEGSFSLWHFSDLTLHGSNFMVDGQPAYGTITGTGDTIYGTLTGALTDDTLLNNDFIINNYASLILIPEPSALLLFGLGAVMLRRKD
ncbi:MAG: PEP-CTERM sorting domain-containing protein [Planctomycetota bacterium]